MSREVGWKDSGDRVIVINPAAFGRHGMVMYNDGCGEVAVALDGGGTFRGYEDRDLIYEDELLPSEPVDVGVGPADDLPDEPVLDDEGNQIGDVTTVLRGEVTE